MRSDSRTRASVRHLQLTQRLDLGELRACVGGHLRGLVRSEGPLIAAHYHQLLKAEYPFLYERGTKPISGLARLFRPLTLARHDVRYRPIAHEIRAAYGLPAGEPIQLEAEGGTVLKGVCNYLLSANERDARAFIREHFAQPTRVWHAPYTL